MSLLIDGGHGEGGGSIVRYAAAFSVLLNKPIEVFNIRKNRPQQGLKHQHVIGLQLLKEISNAETSEIKEKAISLRFMPDKIIPGTYYKKIDTAASIGLIIQILQIALSKTSAKITFNFKGGATFNKWAPSLTYLEKITFSNLKKIGLNIKINIKKHGFYPKGGAIVNVEFKNSGKLKGLELKKLGNINQINCISIASSKLEKAKVAERQSHSLVEKLQKKLNQDIQADYEYVDTLNPGSGICAWIETDEGIFIGSDFVGEKKLRSEVVGERCAVKLLDIIQSKSTVDTFQADQLIPFMFLSEFPFYFITNNLTNHTRTNIWLGEQFFRRKIEVRKENNNYRIEFNG